jgi:hypothetical protein
MPRSLPQKNFALTVTDRFGPTVGSKLIKSLGNKTTKNRQNHRRNHRRNLRGRPRGAGRSAPRVRCPSVPPGDGGGGRQHQAADAPPRQPARTALCTSSQPRADEASPYPPGPAAAVLAAPSPGPPARAPPFPPARGPPPCPHLLRPPPHPRPSPRAGHWRLCRQQPRRRRRQRRPDQRPSPHPGRPPRHRQSRAQRSAARARRAPGKRVASWRRRALPAPSSRLCRSRVMDHASLAPLACLACCPQGSG